MLKATIVILIKVWGGTTGFPTYYFIFHQVDISRLYVATQSETQSLINTWILVRQSSLLMLMDVYNRNGYN